jgi:AmmeMemoRadiSam system protein A
MSEELTIEEKKILLQLARKSLEAGVHGEPLPRIDETLMTPTLNANGASFVTLTVGGNLRGCIGALEPYQPLVEDVCEHSVSAALEDYRFPKVQASELNGIEIEISRLTVPVALEYSDANDLLTKLRPGTDGILIREGSKRATFLPQVWVKIPDPVYFLENLCQKMGVAPNTWRRRHLDVLIYQVEEFHE